MTKNCTPKQEKFCLKYVECGNAAEAYRFAYDVKKMSAANVQDNAGNMLRTNPVVIAKVAELRSKVEKKIMFGITEVLKDLVDIATCDVNELVEYRTVDCPVCKEYDLTAGQGCKKCGGIGKIGDVIIKDTAKLSPQAKKLYKGIRQTSNGPELMLRDQDAALLSIAKYLGMFKQQIEFPKGLNVNVGPIVAISAVTKDPVEAAKVYQQLMG